MRRAALLAALAITGVSAAPALSHEGNPDYESIVTGVTGVEGLRAQVVNGDDRLLLINTGPDTVIVEGYDDEPYARIRPHGDVEINKRSSATYLNEERYGGVDVPDIVDPTAEPEWEPAGKNGRFEFHDHRIHWMLENEPPTIDDESERQKINDWRVPLRVDDKAAAVSGSLFWRGRDEGGVSPAVVAGCAAGVLASLAFLLARRRRQRVPRREAW